MQGVVCAAVFSYRCGTRAALVRVPHRPYTRRRPCGASGTIDDDYRRMRMAEAEDQELDDDDRRMRMALDSQVEDANALEQYTREKALGYALAKKVARSRGSVAQAETQVKVEAGVGPSGYTMHEADVGPSGYTMHETPPKEEPHTPPASPNDEASDVEQQVPPVKPSRAPDLPEASDAADEDSWEPVRPFKRVCRA